MAPAAVNKVLAGKTKVGHDMTAAAGPGATSTKSVGGAEIFTYGRAKGLFAGMSMSGSSLEPDIDANQRLYGREAYTRRRGPGFPSQQQGRQALRRKKRCVDTDHW